MPHQFHAAEEANPLDHAPSSPLAPPAQTVPQAGEPAPRRYDTQTIQQIIALAEQMQTRHRETLSADEVENLGRDVGVEPEFVRRALAQIEAPAQNMTQFVPVRQKRGGAKTSRRLTRRQRALVMVPAAVYALLMPFAFPWASSGSNALIKLFIFLPAFLAFCVGLKGKKMRLGAFGGIAFALASMLTLNLNALYHGWSPMDNPTEFLGWLALWLGVGVTLGAGGAALRQLATEPLHRRQFQVRFIAETDDEKGDDHGDWV